MDKDKTINIRLSLDLLNQIKKYSKIIGDVNTSSFIRLAITQYINEIKKANIK